MKLRYYQQEAFDAIKIDLSLSGNSIIVIPTAGGKSHVIAATALIVKNVLILQPSQELLIQNMQKLSLLVDKEDIGVYSASFGKKEIKRFTFATIGSIYKVAELFADFDLILMDECHGFSPRDASGMLKTFIHDVNTIRNKQRRYPVKVIGFTATPYRLEIGYHKDDDGNLIASTMLKLLNRMRNKNEKECFWKRIIYNISHERLLEEGFLSPIDYIQEPLLPYTEIPVNSARSDYNLESYARAVVGREAQIIETIAEAKKRYKSVLIFCATTDQARHLSDVIIGSKTVFGETDTKERAETIKEFKEGSLQTIFNVGCLTTGFDHPNLDCIVLLRPTRSIVLYNQMLGRLTRIAEGKTHGTVIDLSDTCKAIGRVETFKLYKNERGLWDLRTERHESWHDKVLFSMQI